MFEQTQSETQGDTTPVRAWALCTNQACGHDREVDAVRGERKLMGDGPFKRLVVTSMIHLSTADGNYVCPECEGACVLSEQPRREIPKYVI